VYAPCSRSWVRWGLRDRGPNGASLGGDDSPEDILAEKYRGAEGVREVDRQSDAKEAGASAVEPQITSAARVNRIAAGAQFPAERRRCFTAIGARVLDRSARDRPSEMRPAAARGMMDEGTGGFECTQCRSDYTKSVQMCMAAEAMSVYVGADGHGAYAHGMRRL
jgi:hypothetical protein